MAIVAIALAAVIFAAIYGAKLINVIVLNWSVIVDWLSDASIMTASICACTLLLGYYLLLVANSQYHQHGFARKIERITSASYSYLRECFFTENSMIITGKTLIIISAIVFTANLFPLFNHFDLFRLWLIILGGIGIVGFGALMFFLVRKCEKSFWPLTLMTVCVLGFMYYLDFFIFTWDRPWITGIVAILLAVLYTIVGIRHAIKARKERLEKAEYEAKAAKKEMEKLQAKTAAKQDLKERLGVLNFYDLVISYFNENKQNELIYWDDIVTFYLEAMRNLAEHDTSKLEANAEQKIHIAWLMSKKSAERSSKFYRVIASVFSESDIEALLLSNVDGSTERVLPEAFAQCQCKKEVVAKFLEDFNDKHKAILYNKVKREFASNELYGLLNALIYSYQKTWDENLNEKILSSIKRVFTFANDCLDTMWQKGEREQLRKQLNRIYLFCLMNGVHALLPAIKQEPQENTGETAVQTQA